VAKMNFNLNRFGWCSANARIGVNGRNVQGGIEDNGSLRGTCSHLRGWLSRSAGGGKSYKKSTCPAKKHEPARTVNKSKKSKEGQKGGSNESLEFGPNAATIHKKLSVVGQKGKRGRLARFPREYKGLSYLGMKKRGGRRRGRPPERSL